MPKLCPKIILEGTRLVGKTDVAFALNEHPDVVGRLTALLKAFDEQLKATLRQPGTV